MGPFPISQRYQYILLVFKYMSKQIKDSPLGQMMPKM